MRFPKLHAPGALIALETGLLALLALLRLYLTGDRDILALNAPHDEFWYVHRAFVGVWSGSYDQYSFMHPQLYAAWLEGLRTFGVSARIGIELAWIASVVYLARSLRRFTGVALVGVPVVAFLLFHPYSILTFDRTLAETLLLVAVTACLAAGLDVWTLRGAGARWAVAVASFSLLFASCYHLRAEGIALLASLAVLAPLTLFARKRWWSLRGFASSRGAALFAWPIVATLAMGMALSTVNLAKWGEFSRFELGSAGFTRALGNLSAIDTGATPLQITVTRQMLQAGYTASPTLAELQPWMDGSIGKKWADIARCCVSVPGEIGTGWFYWAVRDAAASAGWHASAQLAEGKYRAVAEELDRAFASGKLKHRSGHLSSFLDPDVGKWAPSVPSSLMRILQIAMWPTPAYLERPNNPASDEQLQEYARSGGRRSFPGNFSLHGWVVAPPGTLVAVESGGEKPAWAPISDTVRPDVPGARALAVEDKSPDDGDRLAFKTPDGRVGEVALSSLRAGSSAVTTGAFVGSLGVDDLERPGRFRLRADPIFPRLLTMERIFALLFAATILCGLVLALFRRRAGPLEAAAFACLVFFGVRLGLLALLDASSWNGGQPRYLMPVFPLFACAGVLCLASLLRAAYSAETAGALTPGTNAR